MATITYIIVYGVMLGAAYCLMTTGFALLISIGKVFDLAYGSYYIIAPYILIASLSIFGPQIGFIGASIIGVVFAAAVALFVHWQLIRPLRGHTFSIFIITAMFALCVQEVLTYIWGSKSIHVPLLLDGAVDIFGAIVMEQSIIVFIATIVIMLGLWIFISKTKSGLALRSAAESTEASRIVGIKLTRIYLLTGAVGAALGGLAGILLSSMYLASPFIWLDALIIAFFVVIFAGLGNIWAIIPAALIAALIETSSGFLLPHGVFLGRTILLTLMLIFIVAKPDGLFGVRGWVEEEE